LNRTTIVEKLGLAEMVGERLKVGLSKLPAPIAMDHARDCARVIRDNAQMRALLSSSYEIQASVVQRGAAMRDLVCRAEEEQNQELMLGLRRLPTVLLMEMADVIAGELRERDRAI
jgi:uncharacterized iron-regulated protein